MGLYLEAIEGPVEGQKFKVALGVRLGRSVGEIILADPKVSSFHAQVESNDNGQLFLVDRESSNGIKISGKRVQRVALMPGVKFRVGRTSFRVVELFEDPKPVIDEGPENTWKKTLKTQVPQIQSQNRTFPNSVRPFDPMVELEFKEGIQIHQKIVLGYGPRKAGSDVLDIELQDPDSPDIAFELWPEGPGQIRFLTSHPDAVSLNESSTTSDMLKSGDQIRVGSSLIEIRFIT